MPNDASFNISEDGKLISYKIVTIYGLIGLWTLMRKVI